MSAALILGASVLSGPGLSAEVMVEDCTTWLAENPAAWRALPPETLDRLRARVREGTPPLYLWQGTLVCDHIEATLCTKAQGRGACAEVRLGDPERGCVRPSDGPFCITPRGTTQDATVLSAVTARLTDWSPDQVWRTIERDGQPVAEGAALPYAGVDAALWPMGLSLVALLVLFGLGLLWGQLSRLSLGARALVPPLSALLGALLWPGVSTWDLLCAGLIIGGVGWVRGRHGPPSQGALGRFALATILTIALGEVAVRALLPAPAPQPPPQAARLYFEPEARELACQALYPTRYGDALPTLRPLSEGADYVLHVGDSMVEGNEVAPAERFTAMIDAHDEARVHLNVGFSGTGPDHHLRVLKAWWPVVKPAAVVLYLYPGNDLLDLDRAYACCDHGALLDHALDSRCEAPQWSFPLGALLARSPAPYPLRAASSHSAFFAHLSAGFSRLVHGLEPRLGDEAGSTEAEGAWERYSAVIVAIERFVAARGAALNVVLLPTRAALEPEGEANHALGVGDRMAEVLRLAQIPGLDARPMFRGLGRGGSYAHLFSDQGAWNEHLGPQGHQALSNWLQGRLTFDSSAR
ncbi:MAG: hypothetical protein ACPGU1_20105 [Myxococcota bacterium]